MAKNNKQAKKMASAGKSAAQIKAKTGVGSQTAQKYVAKQAPAPARPSQTSTANDQGPAGNTAPRTNPGITTTPPRSTPEIKGLGQGIRLAGENGLGKRDYKTIAETTGKSDEKIIGKLDKINTKLEEKGKAGIDLKSGTGNMLVRNAQKSPPKYRGFGADSKASLFGEGAIGSTLQSMISRPGTPGTWRQGQLIGGREAEPGFNPGGSPDKNRLISGTVIRPTGNIANKGTGQQYELPKRFRDEEEVVEKDPIEKVFSDPDEPAGPTGGDETIETIEEIPEPEEEIDRSASSGAGGLDLASWATGFKKARSARQKSGRSAQGSASQKKNPFKSWAS
jgi:hypothetical protein